MPDREPAPSPFAPRDEPPQDRSDRPGPKYDRDQAARRDLDALVTELNEISGQLTWLAQRIREASPRPGYEYVEGVSDVLQREQIRQGLSVSHYAESLRDAVHQLIGTVHALVDAGPGQPPDLAFSATAQFLALEGAVDNAPSPAPEDGRQLLDEARQTWAWIKLALKRGWKRLWSLISHLTRVKEWSVNGTIDTGLPGTAEAQISVTFG